MLHVVLHSSLKGHHCREKGFAPAAKVHGYERTFFGTVKPAVVHPTFGQSSAVCPTQAQDTTEEHVPPSCTSRAVCSQTGAASSLRSSPAVRRGSLRAPRQASRCLPAGPEPARAASAQGTACSSPIRCCLQLGLETKTKTLPKQLEADQNECRNMSGPVSRHPSCFPPSPSRAPTMNQ